MSLFKQFGTNKNLERTGITVRYDDDDAPEGVESPEFTVARAGGSNIAYQKALDREMKPLRRALVANTVSMETLNRLQRKVFIETCLLGWKHVRDAAGKLIEFSKEAAEKLFTELPELYDDLTRQASTVSLFQIDVEADAKNS